MDTVFSKKGEIMRKKLLSAVLLTLLFCPAVFAQQAKVDVKDEVSKAVEAAFKESNARIDERLSGLEEKYKQAKTLEERFEIKSENLKMKESMVGWWLNIVGILVAVFGVFAPVIITWRAWKVSKRHGKEIKKMERLRKREEAKFKSFTTKMYDTLEKVKQKAKETEYNQILSLGNFYMSAKKYDEAMEEYDKAIGLNEEESRGYCSKGDAFAELNKNSEAIAEYNKAIDRNSKSKKAHNNKGIILVKQKRYDEAMIEFDAVIDLDNKCVEAYVNKGIVFAEKRQFSDALNEANKALAIKPDSINANELKRRIQEKIK